MDQILWALVFCEHFVDTKEKTFFYEDVFATNSIIFEEMTDELNQPLLNLNLHFTCEAQIFLPNT